MIMKNSRELIKLVKELKDTERKLEQYTNLILLDNYYFTLQRIKNRIYICNYCENRDKNRCKKTKHIINLDFSCKFFKPCKEVVDFLKEQDVDPPPPYF